MTGGDGGVPCVAWSSSYMVSRLLPRVTSAAASFTNESAPTTSRMDADEWKPLWWSSFFRSVAAVENSIKTQSSWRTSLCCSLFGNGGGNIVFNKQRRIVRWKHVILGLRRASDAAVCYKQAFPMRALLPAPCEGQAGSLSTKMHHGGNNLKDTAMIWWRSIDFFWEKTM